MNEFVFVPAQVNGTNGKMMFDSGTPEALALNDHLLKQLGPGKTLGHAKVGSGQEYTRTLRAAITIHRVGSVADRGIGITEPAAIYLGYEFLSQFKTIWDWPNQTIYLLQR